MLYTYKLTDSSKDPWFCLICVIPGLEQVWKLRHREAQPLVQSHTAWRQQSQDPGPGGPSLAYVLSAPYSLDAPLILFGNSLLFHVQF